MGHHHHHHCHCCGHETAQQPEAAGHGHPAKAYAGMSLSALLLLGGSLLHATGAAFFQQPYVALAWYIAAYLPVGLPVLKEAWESIRSGEPFSEFTLMSIATLGAFYIGEYPEGVAVMLFYSLGELFQERAINRARHNISALLDVRPERATVIREGAAQTVHPKEVETGEVIEVKRGERVPLDGILLAGSASFNTAALTGESQPRTLHQDEEVLAGMIVMDCTIRLRTIRRFEHSALSRILEMVQEASERKAPAELFIRKFARIYTPVVTGLAALIVLLPWLYSLADATFMFHFNDWLYRALVFLVISCPCALVVSIPLGYFGGIGAASRLGVLFKGGKYLDAISRINTVVFDKTGTLTQGKEAAEMHQDERLKEDAIGAIRELKDLNIANIQILSGDKQAIVTNFARQLGIGEAYGDLMPEDKVSHLETLLRNPHNRVAYVGDGINDTPVLALSHVGIAMGRLGSDAAIETADVVIQTDQPSRVATAIRAGRETRRVIWQNVSLAFGVKLLVLVLGAGGVATLWEAVFADVGVALLAILNALRIQKLVK